MNYTPKEILSFVEENDVKFIRLAFTDINGNLKNIAIMPGELECAFKYGIPFESGFLCGKSMDLLLFPDISTLSVLPWRPKSGRVIRFFCNIRHTDGSDYKGDLRNELNKFMKNVNESGYTVKISTKCEFYLFNIDENGNPTKIPHDNAGYLDIAPFDKCENARREICLSLEEMGFNPQTSRHSYGPGQNEIDFKRSDPISAADNMVYYKTVVKNIAAQNGLFASFMPKPLENQQGSGLHIAISVKKDGKDIFSSDSQTLSEEGRYFIAGILNRIGDMTCFLNPIVNSYKRLAAQVDSLSENAKFLIRIPYTYPQHPSIEIRSADAVCNPYIAFKLLLDAGFKGIENRESLDETVFNNNGIEKSDRLPVSLEKAILSSKNSDFIKENFSKETYDMLIENFEKTEMKYNSAYDKEAFENELYFNII